LVIKPLLELPQHVRLRLLGALGAGEITPPYPEATLVACLGPQGARPATGEALRSLDGHGVGAATIAAILKAVEEVGHGTDAPDLVWSGPEIPGLHARDTRRVYEELLSGARTSLWASTFAFFDGPRAFQVLAERMDEAPELEVVLLLNVQRKPGDTTKTSDLVQRFAEKFWTEEWPGKSRPQVFYDPRSLEPEGPAGVLHAKAVVADGEAVFVTSANLTEAAFDRNIEVGMLSRDRTLAESLTQHFRTLIERELLRALPKAG
jgi:phosphatidylserine/phosphatidylglycerophosphate/cardiolipin synthase-like enzyme